MSGQLESQYDNGTLIRINGIIIPRAAWRKYNMDATSVGTHKDECNPTREL